MSSQVVVDIVDTSIVIPDTSTPDTGVFSAGQISDAGVSNTILPIIGISIIVLVLTAIIIKLSVRRIKDKKRSSNFAIHHTGRSLLRLASLVLMVTISAFTIYNYANIQKPADAVQLRASDTLSVTTEDVVIKVEMEDEPVFAMSESKVKVDTATTNGYKLMSYVDSDSSDLINGSDATAKIKSLESAFSQVLTENTWGMAIVEPENQNAPVFRGIPAGLDNAIPVRVTGDVETEASDATTLYYATYVTPDFTVGKYTGARINYVAIANVFTDDITVNYHSYYSSGVAPSRGGKLRFNSDEEDISTFDDGSTLNTVTYGRNCSLGRIDVSGDCDVVYVGNQPRISKTANVDNEGYASGDYDDDLVQVDPITFPGADMLKVELSYATESCCDYLYVLRGSYTNNDIKDYESSVLHGDNVISKISGNEVGEDDRPLGTSTIIIEGDATTFAFLTDGSSTRYGYYAKVVPVYYEKPSGMQTIEDTLCRVAKSNNMDDDGNLIALYPTDNIKMQSVIIPRADRIRIEVYYILPERHYLDVVGEKYMHTYYSGDNPLSGREVMDYYGNRVYFGLGDTYKNIQSDGLGYYAEVSPIYDSETENTLLTETCTFERKSGNYKEPSGFRLWYYPDRTPIFGGAKISERSLLYDEFYDEGEVMSFLNSSSAFNGKAVDLYAITGQSEMIE